VARGMGKEMEAAEVAGREPEVETTSATGKEWTGRVDDAAQWGSISHVREHTSTAVIQPCSESVKSHTHLLFEQCTSSFCLEQGRRTETFN
jgi:hypothetical protein